MTGGRVGREKVETAGQTDTEDGKLEKEERPLWAWPSTVYFPALLSKTPFLLPPVP